MRFRVIISDELKKTLVLLKRKDKTMFQMVEKKIMQIASSDSLSVQHFKNLRRPLNNYKRVHLGSNVLLFRVQEDAIIFEGICMVHEESILVNHLFSLLKLMKNRRLFDC